ncbi:MAG: hypothetical protein V3U97_04100 [bacterium]
MGKNWENVIGGRRAEGIDTIAEISRKQLMDREEKKMKRQDELEALEHEAKVEKLEGGGKKEAEPLVQLEPMKINLQKGQEDAEARAKAAEAQSIKDRESNVETQKVLEHERVERMTDGLKHDIGDLKKMIESGKDNQSISDKMEEIKKTATDLGWGPKQPTTEIPGDIQVKLQQMNNDMQLKLEEMKDDRSRRDNEWKLTLKKWNDEKEFKQAELQQKAAAEAERAQLMRGGIDTLGKIIGESLVENKGVGVQPSPKQFSLEANVGEGGDMDCPLCKAAMFLPPDANKVMCSTCGSTGTVNRIPSQETAEAEPIL